MGVSWQRGQQITSRPHGKPQWSDSVRAATTSVAALAEQRTRQNRTGQRASTQAVSLIAQRDLPARWPSRCLWILFVISLLCTISLRETTVKTPSLCFRSSSPPCQSVECVHCSSVLLSVLVDECSSAFATGRPARSRRGTHRRSSTLVRISWLPPACRWKDCRSASAVRFAWSMSSNNSSWSGLTDTAVVPGGLASNTLVINRRGCCATCSSGGRLQRSRRCRRRCLPAGLQRCVLVNPFLIARSVQLLDAILCSISAAQGLTACLSLADDAAITVSATSVLTLLGLCQPVTTSALVQARALQLPLLCLAVTGSEKRVEEQRSTGVGAEK